MTFAEYKAEKLKRLPALRLMNILGMVAWRECEYDGAKQHIRLLHPLTWLWVIAAFLVGTVIQGIPDTLSDVNYSLKHETVWF